MKVKKILIFGPLANCDITFGTFLAHQEFEVTIARKSKYSVPDNSPALVSPLPANVKVQYVDTTLELVKLARRADLVVTFTGSLPLSLNIYWVLRKFVGLPPVINIPTGSDITEFLRQKKILSHVYRYILKTVDLNLVNPRRDILESIYKNKINNFSFYRYPHRFIRRSNQESNEKSTIFFHPTRINFLAHKKDSKLNTKANDLFFEQFEKALNNGLDAKCYIIEHGPDYRALRSQTNSSIHSDRYIWINKVGFEQYVELMNKADVIVDQFDIGWMGGIAHEALSIGKPVLTYLDLECSKLVYNDDSPPLLNCYDEHSMAKNISLCANKHKISEIGQRGFEWILRNHAWDKCLIHFNHAINIVANR